MKTTDKKEIVKKLEDETKRIYTIRTTLFKDGESKQISETIYREPFVTLTVEEADRILAMLKEQEIVVRCKDCRYGLYCTDRETTYQCFKWNSGEFGMIHEQNWFCADGVKKDE